MLNYEIDPALLRDRVPAGTELDSWNGKTFVSVVGFLFLDTRVLGVPVPFHRCFEEVNLRFYVRRRAGEEWRRGVVFVKEIVPKPAIAAIARWVYNEAYVSCPMASQIRLPDADRGTAGAVEYRWTSRSARNAVYAEFEGEPKPLVAGSQEEFITEHYWGYTAQCDGSVMEYAVEHPSWRVWRANAARLDCDIEACYGDRFTSALSQPPTSAFVAEGSEVVVFRGERLPAV